MFRNLLNHSLRTVLSVKLLIERIVLSQLLIMTIGKRALADDL